MSTIRAGDFLWLRFGT
ncbi:hypothetical protein Pint_34079 [Pistacia integerrima]|uniref:Uncharacterized protein n=1 Tax=Pistacia integerrima TaxID=434235 RepID=A0ACC0X529_9ROSI|nr:hypothetical protein Pint_34079 [Pistacia integerrima]